MKPKKPAKKTSYELDGLIKHAQVARVLLLNKVTLAEFYIAARLCQEHLPPSTLTSLKAETSRQKPKEKLVTIALYPTIKRLEAKGFVTLTKVRQGNRYKETRVNITQQGWIFYLLLLAEMERAPREVEVFANRRKPLFKTRPHRAKAGSAIRKARFSALARKRGLSIWERCALASLPQWQRLENGAPKSTAPVSTSATSGGPSKR